MVVDDSLCMRIYSCIDYILINKTIKQIKQKIDFTVFCGRHLGLIVTAVTINGFTPVMDQPTRVRPICTIVIIDIKDPVFSSFSPILFNLERTICGKFK